MSCRVCLPRRLRGAKCKYVSLQADKAAAATKAAQVLQEMLTKFKLDAMTRERDEYRKIVMALLQSDAKVPRPNGHARALLETPSEPKKVIPLP